ncbi:hypothetical protein E2C01_064967 [Portunus trituberculatus]|uniref:Uncharacterized protein n=1 Tax=Portunus trituberculatus TaxID=210409 RepID=A0A5B7HKM1_PORTR|nr:hypothetical protein [Portunus trituberculatus]
MKIQLLLVRNKRHHILVNVSWSRRPLTTTAFPNGPVFTMTTPYPILGYCPLISFIMLTR